MYSVLIVSLLWGASNALEMHCGWYVGLKWYIVCMLIENVSFKLITTDLLMQAITPSPGNYLPRPGTCGTVRSLPPAQVQQRNRNGTVLFFNTLQNQLDAPFCLGLIVSILSEPTLLYIYENSLTQGNLSVRSDADAFSI